MDFMKCLVFIILAVSSVRSQTEGFIINGQVETTSTTPAPTTLPPKPEDPGTVVNLTSAQLSIELEIDQFTTQIVTWQASMYEYIISKLSSLSTQWSNLKTQIRDARQTEELSIQTADNKESQSLFLLQAELLNQALQLSKTIKLQLTDQQKLINQWAARVKANDTVSLQKKDQILQDLKYFIYKATNQINGMRSTIISRFKDHFFKIESDRFNENSKLDQMGLNFVLQSRQLITTILIANNSLSKNATQYHDSLRDGINSMVSKLITDVDSQKSEYHDEIMSYIKKESEKLHGNLTDTYSAILFLQQTIFDGLVDDIDKSMELLLSLLNEDLTELKIQYEEKCDLNKQRIKQLSTQLFTVLETVESLTLTVSGNLNKIIDSV